MRFHALLATALIAAHPVGATKVDGAELVLAGGALALCSSLSPRACRDQQAPPGRGPSRYALDATHIDAADSLMATWDDDALRASLRSALESLSSRYEQAVSARWIEDALLAKCTKGDCAWARLDDYQRAGLMAALELPQLDAGGSRVHERVSLQSSREQGGVRVIERLVAAARSRSQGGTPRIAVVTASGFDPFDAVDYYTSLFTEAGAEAVWWPLDASLAALIADDGDCATLRQRQTRQLGLPDRSAVFPDHVAAQAAWCASEGRTDLPEGIHGIFFAGGDQWRLRRAFFDAKDMPYPWLVALRERHARGELVVGGTSAGTAVQSGPGMLSNGAVQQALQRGPLAAPPPTPGCGRAQRCGGLSEDAFTVWPNGGFGLAGPFLMDTHFSERAREWRLLRALAEGPADFGLGVDETSALHLRRGGENWHMEALGASGGWLFEVGTRECGKLSGRAHYLAPGLKLVWSEQGGLRHATTSGDEQTLSRESAPMPALALEAPAASVDPFAQGAVRAGLAALALGQPTWQIKAPGASLTLTRSDRSATWTGTGNHPGLTALDFTFSFTEPCGSRR